MFLFPRRIALISAFGLSLLLAGQDDRQKVAPRVQAIRFWSFGDVTRVAIETTGDYKLQRDTVLKPSRVFFDLTGLAAPSSAQQKMQTIPVNDHRIREIRVARISATKTRIVFDLDSDLEVISSQLVNPDRLMIEVRPKGTSLPELSASRSVSGSHKVDLAASGTPVGRDIASTKPSKPSSTAKTSQDDPDDAYHPKRNTTTVVANSILPPVPAVAWVSPTSPPVEESKVAANLASTNKIAPPAGLATAQADSAGDRSLVRVLGLKLGRVVIDAGHGGHDSGTIGPNGLMEKDLVLDVALRLGALITKHLGADVVYTRSTDVFIPLEQRTKIANDQKADLFISVHANSASEPAATGVETYYFNLTSDKTGLDLATRENASAGSSISDLNDLLHRAVLQTKKEESREFAQKVQASLTSIAAKGNNHSADRGVKQAPFVVLIGATMPSILAEIGFVSNPHEERQLRRSEERQRIAEALYKGVAEYANSLSHVQIARARAE